MPSKKELEGEIQDLRYALEMTGIEGREIIGELNEVVKRQAAQKHTLEGKYNSLQTTIVELNKRNNRLRDHIVRAIEHG